MNLLSYILQLFFPRRCVLCHRTLEFDEKGICTRCHTILPRLKLHTDLSLQLEQLFWGKIPLGRAACYSLYHRGNSTTTLVHQLKYKGRSDLGVIFGRQMGIELQRQHFFEGIDLIIPVPLHPRKERERGYNQSLCLAQGIAAVTQLPIETNYLIRRQYTQTQTHKSSDERWNNVSGVFTLQHPEALAHRHILLIDDVLTTSATLTACADTFKEVPGITISILTLGWSNPLA